MMPTFKCLLIGPPGAGKGTIASRLVEAFSLKHFCAGDIVRYHITQKTSFGVQAMNYISEGKLVPDTMIISVIEAELNKIRNQDWLLDGFPRTIGQAEMIDLDIMLHGVINLNVPFQTIIDRIKGRWIHQESGRTYNMEFNPPKKYGVDDVTGDKLIQRADDKPEAVSQRLNEYQQLTQPILEFYRQKGVLVEFSGTESNAIWPGVKRYVSGQLSKYHTEKIQYHADQMAKVMATVL